MILTASILHSHFIVRVLFLWENLSMKDIINALTDSGFDFDMAVILSENFQEDYAPIIREFGEEYVDRIQPESNVAPCR